MSVFVAAALMATNCSSDDRPDEPTAKRSSVEILKGRDTVLRSSRGVEVRVAAGNASGGTLTISEGRRPPVGVDAADSRGVGDAVEVAIEDGRLTGEAMISFPLDDADENTLPLVERFDPATETWVLEPVEHHRVEDGMVSVIVDHFSWYRPSWLSVDKVAEKVRALWLAVFGDGLAGGQPPTCPRDSETLGRFDWDSSTDDTVFWCVGTNDDGTAVLNVVNNNRYPIALTSTSDMTDIGKFGGSWFSAANLGANFDQWGSGQVVLEAREGVTFTLDRGVSGSYEVHSDFTLLTWAVAMLGVALETYVDIWTKSGTAVETVRQKLAFAVSTTACYGEVAEKALTQSDLKVARAMLVESFACAGEVFKAAIADSGLLAKIAGTVVAFVAGPVVAAFEGLVALGELTYDSVRRRATYDLALSPVAVTPKPASNGLVLSATGLGVAEFGDAVEPALESVADVLGEPVEDSGWEMFVAASEMDPEVRDSVEPDRFYAYADDPISDSWDRRWSRRACWVTLCLTFGGASESGATLTGWELAVDADEPSAREPSVELVLADTGIGLGSTWADVQNAYPGVVAAGGEGNSLVVAELPWDGIFDGVGDWRMTGVWDFDRPNEAPADARITRLSAGDGPEPGCC